MEQAQAIIVERSTHLTVIKLFRQAVKNGQYTSNEFGKFVDDVLHYGMTMEAMIQSNRLDKDVFKNVNDIVVTSKKDLFSEN